MSENADSLAPLREHGEAPEHRLVLRRLLECTHAGSPPDLWLAFPQSECCYSFGDEKRPLPIGALFYLWSWDRPFVQDCPACGGLAYAYALGGLLSTGGAALLCPSCGRRWFQQLGGLAKVALILKSSPLEGTPFRVNGMRFGGTIASDGAELCAILGVSVPPIREGQVYANTEDGVAIVADYETDTVRGPDGEGVIFPPTQEASSGDNP